MCGIRLYVPLATCRPSAVTAHPLLKPPRRAAAAACCRWGTFPACLANLKIPRKVKTVPGFKMASHSQAGELMMHSLPRLRRTESAESCARKTTLSLTVCARSCRRGGRRLSLDNLASRLCPGKLGSRDCPAEHADASRLAKSLKQPESDSLLQLLQVLKNLLEVFHAALQQALFLALCGLGIQETFQLGLHGSQDTCEQDLQSRPCAS